LRDIHFILKNPETEKNAPVIRAIKNLTRQLKRTRQTLILTSHTLIIHPEIQEEVTVIDFPLPNIQEIDYLIHQLIVPEKLNLNGLGKEQLIKACQGLSRARIRRVLAAALAAKGQVNETD
ncbi:MAG: AAA family ATPase, partial [Dolichospermum sp.]